MLAYAAVLIPCLAMLAAAPLGSRAAWRRVVLLCVLVLTAFAALRGYVGTDTYAYHAMFSELATGSVSEMLEAVEPAFALLMKSVALVSEDSFAFVTVVALVQGLLLWHIAATSRSPLEFLALYVAVFYLNFHFNIIRAGMAILLLVLAMRVPKDDGNRLRFYAYGVAAVLTHYSMLIGFFPLLLLRERPGKALIALSIVLLAGAAYLVLGTDEVLLARYLVYADILAPDVTKAVSLSFILSVPLYLLLYASCVDKSNWVGLSLLFAVWLLLRWLTSVYTLVGRVEIIVNALLLFSVVEMSLAGRRLMLRRIAVTGIAAMWLVGSLVGLQDEDEILARLGASGLHAMSPFVPYRFVWDDR